jgi:hypothetical protein
MKINIDGTIVGVRGRLLKGWVDAHGYRKVAIKGKSYSWHRVVAKALIPNPEDKPEVNHIDGDKLNNHPSNLEWATREENIQHSFSMGLHNNHSGERHNTSTITDDGVKVIREMSELGWTQKTIAGLTGVSQPYVSKLCRGVYR